jgi:hypothetical protein
MSITIPTVQPGDLIKADAWNYLVQQLIALDKRLSALEAITPGAGNAFAITGLSSTSLHVGDSLTVYGVNFGPALLNTVWIGSTAVSPTAFDQQNSDNTHLVFTIPPIDNLPQAGANVTMVITNPQGSDHRTFFLAPFVSQTPTGTLVVAQPQWQDQIDAIGVGGSVLLFGVQALVNISETYNAMATTTFPGATAAVVDAGNAPVTTVTLPAMKVSDTPVQIRMLVTIPAGTTTGTGTATLNLVSQKNPTGVGGGFSTSQTFTFGSAPPHPGDISVTLVPTAPATLTRGVLAVPAGVTCTVQGQLVLPTGAPTGTYTIAAPTFATGATGWTPGAPSGFPISVPFTSGGTLPRFAFTLVGVSAATSPTTMTLNVGGPAGHSGQQSLTVQLQ